MSRDIPIIFSAYMVLALLAGKKTMTRRMLYVPRKRPKKGQPNCKALLDYPPPPAPTPQHYMTLSDWHRVEIGDRLWVRESVQAVVDSEEYDAVKYLADGAVVRSSANTREEADRFADQLYSYRERKNAASRLVGVPVPSIHMPRWVSRITIEVTGTKISEAKYTCHNDILAEGIRQWPGHNVNYQPRWHWLDHRPELDGIKTYTSAGDAWRALWTKVNGQAAYDLNPKVIAISGRVIQANIDNITARAA